MQKISTELAKELHKPVKHKFKRLHTIVFHKDEIWGADLCDMPGFKKYKFILTVIDLFTRYA